MDSPDKWVIVRIETKGEVIYKLLCSWYGGYLDGDRWRINSGIERIELSKDENFYLIYGYSGSTYKCRKGIYGMNGVACGVYNKMREAPTEYNISLMDEDTDWLNLKIT